MMPRGLGRLVLDPWALTLLGSHRELPKKAIPLADICEHTPRFRYHSGAEEPDPVIDAVHAPPRHVGPDDDRLAVS